jgi:hypothetical protein
VSGYLAIARLAEDISGQVQLRGVELHIIEGEREPEQPADSLWERT